MNPLAGAMLAAPLRARATAEAGESIHPAYRPDVDGLRAVAVLAVVAFHFFPAALPGGFVGVDIFFVISGYLISRILIDELQAGRFSFVGFYARRIRRIFPALILVLAVSLAFGWTALLRAEYAQLGGHALAGAAFVSNLALWSESGYFDTAAIAKPLLHLWSLGVEEQFYLVWPVLLCLAWLLRWNLFRVALGLALLSLAASLLTTPRDPVAAFYSPATRFWELMAGAMLACRELGVAERRTAQPKAAALLSVAGAALVALAIVFMQEQDFPGWQALVPVAGAALLILAGPRSPVNQRVLSRAPLVALGLVSYPLYLWHWPLLSFSRIVKGELGTPVRAMLISIAVILAVLTHRLLERPLKAAPMSAGVALVLAALMATVGGLGLAVSASDGLEQRAVVGANVSLESAKIQRPPRFATPCAFVPAVQKHLFMCFADTREPPRFALLGDSKAGALVSGVFGTSERGGTWLFVGSGEIGPLVPVLSDSPVYAYVSRPAVDAALLLIERTPSIDTVVIATATRALFGLANDHSIADLPASPNAQMAFEGLQASVARLLAAGKRVVLVVDNPTLPHMEDCIVRKTALAWVNSLLPTQPPPACRLPLSKHLEMSRPYRDMLAALQERHPGKLSLFDTVPLLCEQGVCGPTRDGRVLYGITDHLSYDASVLVGQALNAHLQVQDLAPARPVAVRR